MLIGSDTSGETPSPTVAQYPGAGVGLEPLFHELTGRRSLSLATCPGFMLITTGPRSETMRANIAASVIMPALPSSIPSNG